jgi:hypothetical protein
VYALLSVLKWFRHPDSEAEHAAAVIPLSRLQAQLEQLQHGEQMLLEFHARLEATVSQQRKLAYRPETGKIFVRSICFSCELIE